MRWWQLKKHNTDLERELRSDLSLEEEEQRELGRSAEEARHAAQRAFGNVGVIAEQTREAWGWTPFEGSFHDLRYAGRQLRSSPGFALAAISILALGIGAVTAVFSLIDAALLKMLPVQNPEQLVQFNSFGTASPVNDAFSYPTFDALRGRSQVLAGAIAFRKLHNIDLEIDGQSSLAEGQLVSGDYFSVLGVKAIRGRTILPTDESVTSESPVAVIGYDYWRSRFGFEPDIIGKKILLNNSPYTIVGVTEPEFYGVQSGERISISVPLTTISLVNPGFAATGSPYDVLKAPFRNWLYVMARLAPGVTKEKATAVLQPVFLESEQLAAASLAGMPFDSPAARQSFFQLQLQLDPAGHGLAMLRHQFSKPLWIVMAVVLLLLLITCANVASLLLARANAREKEMAVRLAVGAGRSRLMRQLMAESVLLAVTGGVVGIALAYLGSRALLNLMAHGRSPVLLSVHPDLGVLAFALSLSLLTALVFGTVPAWRAAAVHPSRGLAPNSRSSTGEHHKLGRLFVVGQIAISLVLLIGAGLLTRSLANLGDFYPGFGRDHVLLFSVQPTIIGYKDVVPLYEELLRRIRAIPGVLSASLSTHEPLSTNVSDTSIRVQGSVLRQGDDLTPVDVEPVGPEYFATMQISVLHGRQFTSSDRAGTAKVAVVNEGMARHYFGNTDPIGRLISIPGYRGDASWIRIVGVVGNVKVHDLRESTTLMLYLPLLQAAEGGATFEVRTSIDSQYVQTSVLNAVRALDARLPLYAVKTLADQLDDSLVEERLVASLSATFGLLGLLLTGIGLYGLMAYAVNRRCAEIGIRIALGAARGQISRMVLRETFLLVVCGLAIGTPASLLASRLIASQLFGLKPADVVTFLGAGALMLSVAWISSYVPALRAASVDPADALRNE